jgi:hypothetical protein
MVLRFRTQQTRMNFDNCYIEARTEASTDQRGKITSNVTYGVQQLPRSPFERSRFAADAFACLMSAVCVKE